MKRFDLREFRRDKRVTQSELAELFQCKQNFISRIENGERTLPPEKLDILQDKYGDISKYYKEVSDTDEHMTINASPQEFINAGADAFTRQLVKMMNEKLIAPYSALLEKDMIIERLNREIGRLEMQLEDAKKTVPVRMGMPPLPLPGDNGIPQRMFHDKENTEKSMTNGKIL